VVRRREHDTDVRAHARGEVRDGGRRQDTEPDDVHARARQTGDHSGFEELPGSPGVPRDHRGGTAPLEGPYLGEDTRRGDRQVERELRGKLAIGETTDSVGAEEPAHDRSYRLEYCGALRAFLSPALRRSLARGSRVSMPARFSGGRLASGSTSLSAREM